MASFASDIKKIEVRYDVPLYPEFAAEATAIRLSRDNAVFLNGIKLDLLSAGWFGVADGNIGCNDM